MPPASTLELLESRIAPATLVAGGKAVTYIDGDGDLVTVKTTKGVFMDPATPSGTPQFTFGATTTGIGQQLRMLDLSAFPEFDGTSITITAAPSDIDNDGDLDGDGLVNVGYIRGRNLAANVGIDFGSVVVRGDLGAIDAGDNLTDPGLGSLSVLSLGVEGLSTGAPDLQSEILGPVGSIRIAGDVAGASIGVFGNTQSGTPVGKIGTLTIGGSVFGAAADNSGSIFAIGSITTLKIGGGLFGGSGKSSGIVQAGSIGTVTIDGAIGGGAGESSGNLFAATTLGKVTVGGSIFGGSGISSGRISAQKIGPVTIGGSLAGGSFVDATHTAQDSGVVYAFQPTSGTPIAGAGTLGAVKIGGSIIGGSGGGSGAVAASVSMASATVGGALTGGERNFSGVITAPTLGPVKIGGSVFGGVGNDTGVVAADTLLKGVTVGGSIVGGDGAGSGLLRGGGNMGPIQVSGAIFGGDGQRSGAIVSGAGGNFSTIIIGAQLQGGAGVESGEIFTPGSAKSIIIGGSLLGGTASGSGMVRVDGTLGALTVGGNIIGGNAATTFVADTGYVVASHIGSVLVGGSIFAGSVTDTGGALVNSGAIRSSFEIGTLTVRGSLQGSVTNPVIISAAGMQIPGATDLAFKSIQILGSAFNAKVLAGYSPDTQQSYLGLPVNADAQIGSVKIGGDWAASDLIAGIVPGADGFFGDAADTKIAAGTGVRDRAEVISKISSIVVGGRVYGTRETASAFHSGIGAEHLVSLKVGGTSIIPLQPGAHNDLFGVVGRAYALGGTQGTGVPDGFDMHVFEIFA